MRRSHSEHDMETATGRMSTNFALKYGALRCMVDPSSLLSQQAHDGVIESIAWTRFVIPYSAIQYHDAGMLTMPHEENSIYKT